jgi:hypothetical protein
LIGTGATIAVGLGEVAGLGLVEVLGLGLGEVVELGLGEVLGLATGGKVVSAALAVLSGAVKVTKIVATKPKATAVASRAMMMGGLGGEAISNEYLIC